MHGQLLAVALSVVVPAAGAKSKNPLIVIDCSLAGATVEIDGRRVGKTPLGPQAVIAGKHVVKITAAGYVGYHEQVVTAAGHTYELHVRLAKSTAGVGDELDLVPLAPRPVPSGGKGSKPQADGPDALELEPIVESPAGTASPKATPPPAAGEDTTGGALTPGGASFGEELPPLLLPWYKRPWIWGVAAGVVLVGSAAVVLTMRGHGTTQLGYDDSWALGGAPSGH
jgi:hypothetical protein